MVFIIDNTDLAKKIQHTLIDFAVDLAAIDRHCEECIQYGFNAAMVPAIWVPYVAGALRGTGIITAAPVDFPYGCMTTTGRVAEAQALEASGVDEIDLGVHVGLLKSGRWKEYRADIAAVVSAVNVPIKVMLELPRLTVKQGMLATDLAIEAGVHWVKNSSSGAAGIATVEDVRFLRDRVPASVHVKASGGISTAEHVRSLLAAGADLVGTSAGISIVTGVDAGPVKY